MSPLLLRAANRLSSMRFARALLITIGCLSLIGTVVPQQEEPAAYLSRFGLSGARWLTRLGLTDLYHSWHFASLLLLLAVSLIVCSIRRWATDLKTLGSIALHLGFVCILAGGIIRQVMGVEGVVELREGEHTNQLKLDDARTQELPFAVRLDDFFFQQTAGNPGHVSEFTSHIRLIDAGTAMPATVRVTLPPAFPPEADQIKDLIGPPGQRQVVRVNHPVTHRGFRIYQLGYNADDPSWTALLLVHDPGTPIVYAGFGVLLAGLVTTFYVVPLVTKRGG